jgi:hypothetical protein
MIRLRLKSALILLADVFLLLSTASFSQNEIIQISEPIKVKSLSGPVSLGRSPEGIKGVLVESCSRDWKTVIASTHTDENGYFVFPNACANKTYFLRLSLSGAHTLLIKAKISNASDKELAIVLEFKT